ncbi:GNAT family N-acetyltransferase [Parabacteroides chinchillae]
MNKKQQVKDLWRTCFGDSEAFIDLYFDRVYQDDNTLTIERNGQIVSALQMLPYTMTYFGAEISVTYISGACTAPEQRGQGLMKQLLQEAFEEMKKRDVAITALIPADTRLFDYYREQGYIEAFDYTTETYIRPQIVVQKPLLTVVPPEVDSMNTLYKYFDKKLRERTCCVLHTYNDFVTILRDLALNGGQMLTALNENEQPVGMIFLHLFIDSNGQKNIYVKELMYDNEDIKALLLQEATLQNNVNQAICEILPTPPSTMPKGMAKVIDTKRLIHHWHSKHPHSPLSKSNLENMDIQTLTQHLLDYPDKKAFISLMLD